MTDENEIDNEEVNNVHMNGKIENYQQPPLSIDCVECHIIYSHCFFVLEMLVETNNNSKIECHIYNVLRKHFLEQRSITWKPIKVELVVNTQLTDDFFGKYQIFNHYFFFSN